MTHYQTSDLYLAAYIRARTDLTPALTREGGRSTFHFSGDESFGDLQREYYSDRQIMRFIAAIRDMKAMVHSA